MSIYTTAGAAALLALCLPTSTTRAQDLALLRAGVDVRRSSATTESRGAWVSLSDQATDASRVARAESRWVEGMLIGAAAGAVVGAVSVWVNCSDTCGDETRGFVIVPVTIVGGLVGGLAGGIIGAFIRTD